VENERVSGKVFPDKTDLSADLELFEERAAIREFCGGMTRADAEAAASEDVKRWRETCDRLRGK